VSNREINEERLRCYKMRYIFVAEVPRTVPKYCCTCFVLCISNPVGQFLYLLQCKRLFDTLKTELKPICHLPVILGAHHILNVSRVRVKGNFVMACEVIGFPSIVRGLVNGKQKVMLWYPYLVGDRSSTVVKVLCYKSEDRWFDPSWCQWNFSLT